MKNFLLSQIYSSRMPELNKKICSDPDNQLFNKENCQNFEIKRFNKQQLQNWIIDYLASAKQPSNVMTLKEFLNKYIFFNISEKRFWARIKLILNPQQFSLIKKKNLISNQNTQTIHKI